MSASLAALARPENIAATACAPRISAWAPMRTVVWSARSTTSGSSTATSAPRSPLREAARNARTTSRRRVRSVSGPSPRPGPGAARGWPAGAPRRGALDDGGDLLERHGEHVVQHEREPLGGISVSSTTSSARPTESASTASCSGPVPSALVAIPSGRWAPAGSSPGFPRPQHVEGHPGHDRRQPPVQVLDRARVGAVEPDPRLLHHVVGFAHGAEHPVGHSTEMRADGPRIGRPEPVVLAHRSHSFTSFTVMALTNERRPM